MSETIVQAEMLTEEQKRKLFGWGEDIFGVEGLNVAWRPKDVHFLLLSDGEPVSHVGVLRLEVKVSEQAMGVGGVGGVVTVPGQQNKGYAARLMRHAAEFFDREWEVDAGLLFCLPKRVDYYSGLGWIRIDGPVDVEQKDGSSRSPLPVMVLPIARGWPAGPVDLQSLPW